MGSQRVRHNLATKQQQPINNVVIVRRTAKRLSHTYTCIHSPRNSTSTQAMWQLSFASIDKDRISDSLRDLVRVEAAKFFRNPTPWAIKWAIHSPPISLA